ncbi:MAG: DUF465 domain-containing protein [Gammaproteobacteria bacterium]|nr:MAG: DUF465 domain-containing protein [Gammaproteobacteria bacterium]
MPLSHHPLVKEFPEYQEKIRKLQAEDSHFAGLMERYEMLDDEIYRIEANEIPADDLHLEELKKERVHLKDTLYQLLKH